MRKLYYCLCHVQLLMIDGILLLCTIKPKSCNAPPIPTSLLIHNFSIVLPVRAATNILLFINPHATMLPVGREHSPDKRKSVTLDSKSNDSKKRARTQGAPSPTTAFITPHDAVLAELNPKYDILVASVISSTQIRKRVTYVLNHLLKKTEKPPVVLLHARTADVCKLITVVEQCKRVMVDESKAWCQYNQLFDLPQGSKMRDIVEETVLGQKTSDKEDDSDGDHFEVMHSRFENAVLPRPVSNTTKSMRIFLSVASVPELRSKPGITTQTSMERKT